MAEWALSLAVVVLLCRRVGLHRDESLSDEWLRNMRRLSGRIGHERYNNR